MTDTKELQAAVKTILWQDWDPIGVNDNPKIADEYDTYVPPIASLVSARTDSTTVAAHLLAIETDRMGLKGDAVRTSTVARKLCALVPPR